MVFSLYKNQLKINRKNNKEKPRDSFHVVNITLYLLFSLALNHKSECNISIQAQLRKFIFTFLLGLSVRRLAERENYFQVVTLDIMLRKLFASDT